MNNSKRIMTAAIALFTATAVFLVACKKETSGTGSQNPKNLSVYLTDDPCQFDSVFIDIRTVEVKLDTSKEHRDDDHFGDKDENGDDDHEHHDSFGYWDTLNIRPGVYNIMKLRNGLDTLLGSANLPAGALRKIRITLGTDNTLFNGGVSYPLQLLPGTNHYVYIKTHQEDFDQDDAVNARVWLDFDVCRSIIQENGQYYLKPGIRPFGNHQRGQIEGRVLPRLARSFIKAYNATDTATAIPGDEGEFRIRGLKEGTYSVLYMGFNGYKDTLVSNVQVYRGKETKLPLVTLHP
ncbi:MAG: DUF4382 domain-containing protein [Flavisolibacter sp.]